MLIPFRRFRAKDMRVLVPNCIDEKQRQMTPGSIEAWGKYYEKLSVAYTAVIDDEPVMAAGIILSLTKRGQAWAFMTEQGQRHKLSVLRSTKTMLGFVLEACDIRYVRASIRHDLKGADTFARHLGFKRVRTMIGNTHDYYRLEVA